MKYIVGDVHGEITKVKGLLKAIQERDKHPEFIFIGDYIDKGENAVETLKFLIELEKRFNCTFLYGNHEYLWLNMKQGDDDTKAYLIKHGAAQTMQSLNTNDIFQAQRKLMDSFGDFFLNLKPYWKGIEHIAVHSGVKPEDYDRPMEQIDVSSLIFNRYDFIKQERRYLNKYIVVFGHTGFYSPYVDLYKIGIDTSACYIKDQPLTAYSPDLNSFIDSGNNNYKLKILLNNCPNIPRTKPYRA
jgi:serine/threonine protein phosphatase 1